MVEKKSMLDVMVEKGCVCPECEVRDTCPKMMALFVGDKKESERNGK